MIRNALPPILCGLMFGAPAFADVPRVLTDIPPVQSLVAQVMGDLGTAEVLLTKGADEHDFQMKPSQMAALSQAGLVVWIGPELTPWLDRALHGSDGVAQLTLLHAQGTQLLPYAEDHGDEHDHEDEAHADEAHADEGANDPHAWLDPTNASVWLSRIAESLSDLDPEHADTYAANAAAAQARLVLLDSELAAQLAPLRDQGFVTFHAAYGYFTDHYHLNAVGSVALGDAAAPGAARLQALRERLAQGDVVCAFPEIQHDPKRLTQVMDGSGTRLGAALDPVGSGAETGPLAYETLLRGMASTLADCLSGAATAP